MVLVWATIFVRSDALLAQDVDREAQRQAMLRMMQRREQAAGLVAGQAEDSVEAPGAEKLDVDANISIARKAGTLESLSNVLSQVLVVEELTDGSQFLLPKDFQQANTVRSSIGQVLRSYGGHSSSNGNGYVCSFSGPTLSGFIQSSSKVSLALKELTGDRRTLFAEQNRHSCRCVLSSPEGYYFSISFQPDHSVCVIESDNDFLFNRRYASFGQLQLADAKYCSERLQPILARFGIKVPDNSFSKPARELAAALLLNSEDQKQQFAQKYLESITAKDYQTRQSAATHLKKEFAESTVQMVSIVLDDVQPAELRHLFTEVIQSEDSELSKLVENAFLAKDLLHDLAFLTWMLDAEEAKEEKNTELVQRLRERLSTISDLPSDSSVEQWMEVATGVAKQQLPELTSIEKLPMLSVEAKDVGLGLTEVVPLVVDESGRLKLDRSKWIQPFGNQSLEQHYVRLREEIQKSGFPENWLTTPSGYSLAEDAYALVLFEKIQITGRSNVSSNQLMMMRQSQAQRISSGSSKSLTRYFGGNQLSIDMGRGAIKLDSSPFNLNWQIADAEELSVNHLPDGKFNLIIQDYQGHSRMIVQSTDDKFVFQCFVGDEVANFSAESYRQFCQEHPDIYRQLKDGLAESVRLMLPEAEN